MGERRLTTVKMYQDSDTPEGYILYLDEWDLAKASLRALTRNGMSRYVPDSTVHKAHGIRLNRKNVQKIMDDLWAFGIRPQSMEDNEP